MLKKILAFQLMLMITVSAFAQYAFDRGDLVLNGGIGFFSMDGAAPSLNLFGEFGLFETNEIGIVSLGGLMEFKNSKINGQSYKQIAIGARTTWHIHFPFLQKTNLDLYTGLGVGLHRYRDYNLTTFVYDPKVSPYMETFIGSRWLFYNNLGGFIEAGYSAMATLKAGITYKLGFVNKKISGNSIRKK